MKKVLICCIMCLFNTGCFYLNPTGAINNVKSEMKSDIDRAIVEINEKIDNSTKNKFYLEMN